MPDPKSNRFAVYTDAGLVAFDVTLAHARAIAQRIKVGPVKIATSSGRVLEVVRNA